MLPRHTILDYARFLLCLSQSVISRTRYVPKIPRYTAPLRSIGLP